MKRFLISQAKIVGLSRTKIIGVCLALAGVIVGVMFARNNSGINSSNGGAKPDVQISGQYIKSKNGSDVDNLLNKLQSLESKTTELPATNSFAKNLKEENHHVNDFSGNLYESVPSIEEVEKNKFRDNQTLEMYKSVGGKTLMYSIKPQPIQASGKDVSDEGSDVIEDSNQYEVKAGSIIPATMLNGLNSELPGDVIAIVRANVYDSVNRNYLLIPQGSKLIGKYDSNVVYAQERIAVAWNRIIYPDGSSTILKAVPGTDLEGYTGFYDKVDNHYFRLFGASFIMGVITGAMQYSQNNTNTGVAVGASPTVGQTMAGSLGQQMGQTGMMITQKNLNVAPTIMIRPNYPFNLLITSDLKLKPFAKVD